MAINASELAVIKSLIDDRKRHGDAVHVVSFGYPDLLMTAENVVKIFGDEQAKTLPRRDDSFRVAVDHGFRMDLAEGVFESFALFKALGAQLTVIDIISWTGCEYIADLDEGFSFAETAFKWMAEEASPRWRDLADQIVKDGLQTCAIYGASRLSELAIQYFQERNIKATCIIDREEKLWGYDIRGVPIVSLKTALQNGETNFYIATERFQEEIKSTLISAEPEKGAFRIFSWV